MGISIGFHLLSKVRTFFGIGIEKDGEIYRDDNEIGIVEKVKIEVGFIFGSIDITFDIGKKVLDKKVFDILTKIKKEIQE